jgi:hypothetical protein
MRCNGRVSHTYLLQKHTWWCPRDDCYGVAPFHQVLADLNGSGCVAQPMACAIVGNGQGIHRRRRVVACCLGHSTSTVLQESMCWIPGVQLQQAEVVATAGCTDCVAVTASQPWWPVRPRYHCYMTPCIDLRRSVTYDEVVHLQAFASAMICAVLLTSCGICGVLHNVPLY